MDNRFETVPNSPDYNKLIGQSETTHGKCPKCGACFDNGDIPKEYHESYSPPYKWSKLMGIELQGVYDGTLIWQCQDCGFSWHRFNGKEVVWPEKRTHTQT